MTEGRDKSPQQIVLFRLNLLQTKNLLAHRRAASRCVNALLELKKSTLSVAKDFASKATA
jgi:hypothetical protein